MFIKNSPEELQAIRQRLSQPDGDKRQLRSSTKIKGTDV